MEVADFLRGDFWYRIYFDRYRWSSTVKSRYGRGGHFQKIVLQWLRATRASDPPVYFRCYGFVQSYFKSKPQWKS